MRNKVMWAIRDASGLNQNEKALLWAIESCGVAKRTWQNMAALAGMKKDAFYGARNSLVTKGLIRVERKYNAVSWYTVTAESVLALPELSVSQNESKDDSATQSEDSVSPNSHSGMPETKENTKNNKKMNQESEEEPTDASAPVPRPSSLGKGLTLPPLVREVVAGPDTGEDAHAAPGRNSPAYESDLAAHEHKWALERRGRELGWHECKRMLDEARAIRERYSVDHADAW